ncbi:TIGR01777 family oxidoreductase [Idiomarina seosinensis]|uniref:TIGR01777 family protein n=1 Tax=Idiomarina seosinensis TaxID=281739 RepID=A0A432ZJ51_9GAMM|nr:TIGR01777 family oxidoreductase [Idiomarina seosinensis]RUO77996.1 TIGR01777 family protein [Idiomarina seosinensis]
MKILMTGGTGLIGSHFIAKYRDKYEFTVTSRTPKMAQAKLGEDVTVIGSVDDIGDIGQFDAVINLQGAGIADKRWTAQRKQELQNSRWQVTEKLASKINSTEKPPKVFVSGSAIGVYGPRDSEPVNEEGNAKTVDFAVDLCRQWEHRALDAEANTRVVLLRTGVVLAEGQGALAKMVLPYKIGLGGPMGSGEQMMSWIHIEDMIRGIDYVLEQPDLAGPVNMTAPGPVANKAFSRTLASVLNRPHIFKVPAFVLKLAMGEMSSMLLEGQAVVPDKLRQHGFEFNYPTVREALSDVT